jgi:hypothetical protein
VRKVDAVPRPAQQSIDQNRDRIDVSEEHECRYWTEKLGVTYPVLKRAVAEVGSLVTDVRRHLAR